MVPRSISTDGILENVLWTRMCPRLTVYFYIVLPVFTSEKFQELNRLL